MSQVVKFSYIYFVSSVILGPLIFYLGFWVFSKGGGLCFDSTPLWEETPQGRALRSEVLQSDGGHFGIDFQVSQIFMMVSSATLIIVGIILFCLLVYRIIKTRSLKNSILPALLIPVMIFGYSIVWLFAIDGCPL